MCGIAGVVTLTGEQATDEAGIRQMLAMIRHRGPDQFGIYLDERAGLGSARLSIIDPKTGQQPIHNEDGSLWIVFNGEIFNYMELRPELEARGHRFTTGSDTEVFLHLYEEFGPECLHHLNGQFAVALWNNREETLFLARDRLGVRPLFYTMQDGALIFGSEVKAILAHPRVRTEIDHGAIGQVLTYWSTLTPRTVFRNIVEIPPGHYLLTREGGISVQRYWEISFPTGNRMAPDPSLQRNEKDCQRELHDLLVDAIRLRLRSDVPVGAYLSGGLDSSIIAALARKYTDNPLDTFSIAFSDPQYDESPLQRQMARALGTNHQVLRVTHADIGRAFFQTIRHTETPITRTAPVPMFLLSELVRDRGFKVVLTGEGADELLAGYDIFKEAAVRRFWARQPNSKCRPLLLQRLYRDIPGLAGANAASLAAFFRADLTEVEAPSYSHAVRWRNNSRMLRFLSHEVQEAIRVPSGYGPGTPDYPPQFAQWGALERSQFLETTIFLSQYLLSSQGDRVAMAHSVEGRFPFLDYRVVEFCNHLPSRMKLRGLTEKFVLKQVGRELLPDGIYSRPKQPYRAPIHRCFFHDATPEYVRELLSPEQLRADGLFNPSAVAHLVKKIECGGAVGETDDMALAAILSTQLVVFHFISAFELAPPLSERDPVKVCIERRSSNCSRP